MYCNNLSSITTCQLYKRGWRWGLFLNFIYIFIFYMTLFFTLREMREMFKFVKVATLVLAFVAGMTR